MNPQQLHDALWTVRDNLEKILIESKRITQEMMASETVETSILQAFQYTDEALLRVCDEYIWSNLEVEEYGIK